jgi:hypothetical protein
LYLTERAVTLIRVVPREQWVNLWLSSLGRELFVYEWLIEPLRRFDGGFQAKGILVRRKSPYCQSHSQPSQGWLIYEDRTCSMKGKP